MGLICLDPQSTGSDPDRLGRSAVSDQKCGESGESAEAAEAEEAFPFCVRGVVGGYRQLVGKETVRSITHQWQPRRPDGSIPPRAIPGRMPRMRSHQRGRRRCRAGSAERCRHRSDGSKIPSCRGRSVGFGPVKVPLRSRGCSPNRSPCSSLVQGRRACGQNQWRQCGERSARKRASARVATPGRWARMCPARTSVLGAVPPR